MYKVQSKEVVEAFGKKMSRVIKSKARAHQIAAAWNSFGIQATAWDCKTKEQVW
jgi:hypothetical protein